MVAGTSTSISVPGLYGELSGVGRAEIADSGETDQLFRRKVDSHSSSNWTLRA